MLEDSEQRASEEQPKSFDERNLTDKVVTIPPKGPGKKPIRGLDPKQVRGARDDGAGS